MWVTTRHCCRSISEAFVSVVAECCSKNHATCPRASSAPPPFLNTVKTHIPSARIHSVMRVGPFQYCTCTCHTCVPHTAVSPVPVCNPIDQRCDLQALHLWTDLQALVVKLSRYFQVRCRDSYVSVLIFHLFYLSPNCLTVIHLLWSPF